MRSDPEESFHRLIETIHSVLSMHAWWELLIASGWTCTYPWSGGSYFYFATNYFHPEVLFHGSWSINVSFFLFSEIHSWG